MASEKKTAEVLGIAMPTGTTSVLWISQQVNRGLPLSSLDRVVNKIAPDDKTFVFRFVSRATLARRRRLVGNALTMMPRTDGVSEAVRATPASLARLKNYDKFSPQPKSPKPLVHRKRIKSKLSQIAKQPEPEGPKPFLSREESAKVARIAEVWAMAREVWGSDEAARGFLFRPHPMLDERTPIDVTLEGEFGKPLVEGILGRLQNGSAA